MDLEAFFLAHLDLIEGVIRWVSRRHRLSPGDADEFGAHARLRLIDRDYEILRRFEGRSSLRTYLTTVIQRTFLDWRIAQWGKWRPSSQARRLGPVAVLLEKLVTRDGLTFDEAAAQLQVNRGITEGRDELYAMFARLPARVSRRPAGEAELESMPAHGSEADRDVRQAEASALRSHALAALQQALAQLPPQDRLIVRMRFEDGFSIADVARALHLDQKPLYRRVEQILRCLREPLVAAGVDRAVVAELLGEPGLDLTMAHGPPHEVRNAKTGAV